MVGGRWREHQFLIQLWALLERFDGDARETFGEDIDAQSKKHPERYVVRMIDFFDGWQGDLGIKTVLSDWSITIDKAREATPA